MSSEILLFGGRNHPHPQQRPAWDLFEAALVLKLRDGKIVQRLEYEGSDLDRQIGLGRYFKAASVDGHIAYACTNTEIVTIDLKKFTITDRFTHEGFNDLHHVTKVGDHYYVASTGTDSVLEFDGAFQLVQRYPVARDEIIERFGHHTDFRRVTSTKPHMAHPNFVANWDNEVWVTNFESRHVESLHSRRRYLVSENKIHDGVPAFDYIWFTAINGEVIKVDPRSGATIRYDLSAMTKADRLLGWCRGIAPVADADVYVGFSKLRETKARENLKWIGNKFLGQKFILSLPTRIARYDLARGNETWRLDLHDYGMDAVFSIHVVRS